MQYTKYRTTIGAKRNVLLLALLQGIAAHAQDDTGTRPGVPAQPAAADLAAADQNAPPPPPPQSTQATPAPAKEGKPGKSAPDTTELGTITVTAQKKSENIQKVPISITAFTGDDLSDRKIETGADLVTATPNVSFTKTNFASYNFQIRGIGTQALSVTTDPAVAVSFNDTPMIRNRLFEQEYFDVNNVEVLRGPQGTLYGRNATAGVVNMIPNLPNFDGFDSWIKMEAGNYDSKRFSGMINVPITDTLAFRAAGAWTDRSGYDYNSATQKDVNGRNLWSGRMSLAWKPTETINANIVWEHFGEHDNRSRTGKQLCHTDPGPETVGGVTVTPVDRNYFSTGCQDGSLYDKGAFGVPNGGSLPQMLALGTLPGTQGFSPDLLSLIYAINPGTNPFSGVTQSQDLRRIATSFDPIFRAKNDVIQFNFDAELNDHLKFISQSLYTRDRYYSSQDYNRFQSNPVFNSTSGGGVVTFLPDGSTGPAYDLLPNGVFCDPQLGCSNRLLSADLTQSYSTQWSQEFRLQSSFDGPFNFNLGANYLYYKVKEDYYVFSNAFTLIAQSFYNRSTGIGSPPLANCAPGQTTAPDGSFASCVYIDPNTLSHINGQGHNYFRSLNVADTRSAALFGEGYWQLSDTVKLTTGLRYTDDRKGTTPYPSQLLLTPGPNGGGFVNSGYPALADIHQSWGEGTGRVVLDWTPQTSFTDSTLLYTSFSRGYKAGGTNSPGIGADISTLGFIVRDPRFKPEFVNAFEVGMKNTLADGKITFNASLFYNDYKNYQVSQVEDRATLNENFDAKTWGAEIELAWKPTREFRLDGNIGLLGTRLGSNQYSIDVMNRTQGNPDWVVVRPWIQQASNCIAPSALVAKALQYVYAGNLGPPDAANLLNSFCQNYPLAQGGFTPGGAWDGVLGPGVYYNSLTDAPNQGQGFAANVGGHSLPNAPHVTVSISPQYTFFTSHGNFVLRTDLYYQGPSWARIYQDRIDRLHGWGNVNLSLTYERPDNDFTAQLYIKNALNSDAITGTFTNSDDSGLTSNVFLQDPRIIGVSVRMGFY